MEFAKRSLKLEVLKKKEFFFKGVLKMEFLYGVLNMVAFHMFKGVLECVLGFKNIYW